MSLRLRLLANQRASWGHNFENFCKPWAMAVLFKGMQELTQDLEQDEIEFCENGRSRCSHLCVNTGRV